MDCSFERNNRSQQEDRLFAQIFRDIEVFDQPTSLGANCTFLNLIDAITARVALVSEAAVAENGSKRLLAPISLQGSDADVLGQPYIDFVQSHTPEALADPASRAQYRAVVEASLAHFAKYLDVKFQAVLERASGAESDLRTLTGLRNELRYISSFQPTEIALDKKPDESYTELITRLNGARKPNSGIPANDNLSEEEIAKTLLAMKQLYYGITAQVEQLSPSQRGAASKAKLNSSPKVLGTSRGAANDDEGPENDPGFAR